MKGVKGFTVFNYLGKRLFIYKCLDKIFIYGLGLYKYNNPTQPFKTSEI